MLAIIKVGPYFIKDKVKNMWNGRWGQQENKKDTLLISLEILWSFILRCPVTIGRFSDEVA